VDFERTELGARLDARPWGSPTCDVADHLPFFPPQTVPAHTGRYRPMFGFVRQATPEADPVNCDLTVFHL
jgi:hypothetical protein